MIRDYAKIVVTAPGTPKQVTGADPSPDYPAIGNVHGVLVQVLKANTGIVYIGSRLMNKTLETGLYAKLAIPTVNNLPTFSAALTLAAAGISLKDLWIDADVANDGVTVSVLVS